MTVIYRISSKLKIGRYYIGSAASFSKRRNKHMEDLKKGKHHSPKLQNHVNKYGINDLSFDILEKIEDTSLLLEREQYYLNMLEPYFNISLIAGSRQGLKNSKSHNDKISKAMKTAMLGNKNGIGNKGNSGRSLSEEHKRKIRENHWRKKK